MAAGQLIYASLALSGVLLVLGYALGIAVVAVEGARRAFLSLASAFLHAPLVFFDAFGAGFLGILLVANRIGLLAKILDIARGFTRGGGVTVDSFDRRFFG